MLAITHLWTRISSVKWEDAWTERLQFAGPQNLVIKKFPASRSIRLDLYTDGATAKKLKSAFGGTVRHFDAAGWQPPASKITDPLRIAGELRIYRDKNLFKNQREESKGGKGLPLLIPSGMAFGTGDHATTARCLQLLVEASAPLCKTDENWSLLDLGCGSGILALAAELLGAQKVLGCDFDEACVRISKENALLNKLPLARFLKADVLRWKPPALKGKPATYDIVAANLYSTILTASSEMIVDAIKPGGVLILSGILSVEERAIIKTFTTLGLKHRKTLKRGKWAAVMLRKG
jgi:ribosomal protein L11 methyltransferase